jgi:enoyl reductase-like protein
LGLYIYYERTDVKIDRNCFHTKFGVKLLKDSTKTRIVDVARNSISELKRNQSDLFENRLSENTIKNQYMRVFERNFQIAMNSTTEYIAYWMDVDYNRVQSGMKIVGVTPDDNRRTLFDLIIHKRGVQDEEYPENLVHFEIKVFNNNLANHGADKERLTITTMGNNDPQIAPYGYIELDYKRYIRGYQLGLFIHFSEGNQDTILAFDNGKRIF